MQREVTLVIVIWVLVVAIVVLGSIYSRLLWTVTPNDCSTIVDVGDSEVECDSCSAQLHVESVDGFSIYPGQLRSNLSYHWKDPPLLGEGKRLISVTHKHRDLAFGSRAMSLYVNTYTDNEIIFTANRQLDISNLNSIVLRTEASSFPEISQLEGIVLSSTAMRYFYTSDGAGVQTQDISNLSTTPPTTIRSGTGFLLRVMGENELVVVKATVIMGYVRDDGGTWNLEHTVELPHVIEAMAVDARSRLVAVRTDADMLYTYRWSDGFVLHETLGPLQDTGSIAPRIHFVRSPFSVEGNEWHDLYLYTNGSSTELSRFRITAIEQWDGEPFEVLPSFVMPESTRDFTVAMVDAYYTVVTTPFDGNLQVWLYMKHEAQGYYTINASLAAQELLVSSDFQVAVVSRNTTNNLQMNIIPQIKQLQNTAQVSGVLLTRYIGNSYINTGIAGTPINTMIMYSHSNATETRVILLPLNESVQDLSASVIISNP